MANTDTTVKGVRLDLIHKGQKDVLIKAGFKWQLKEFKSITDYEIANAINVNPSTYRSTLMRDLAETDETASYTQAAEVIKAAQNVLGTLFSRPHLEDHIRFLNKVINSIRKFESKEATLQEAVQAIRKLMDTAISKTASRADSFQTPPTDEEFKEIFENSEEYYNPSWDTGSQLKEKYQKSNHFKTLAQLTETLSQESTPQILVDLALGTDFRYMKLNYEGKYNIPIALFVLTRQMANYIRPKVEKRRGKFKISKHDPVQERINQSLIIGLETTLGDIPIFETTTSFIEVPQSPTTVREHSETIPSGEVDDLFNSESSEVHTPVQKDESHKSTILKDDESAESYSPEKGSPGPQVTGTSGRDQRQREQLVRDAEEKKRKDEKLRKQLIDDEEQSSLGTINFRPKMDDQIEIMLSRAFSTYLHQLHQTTKNGKFPQHQKRFKSRKDIPVTLSRQQIQDTDHIIPINESHRAIRYVITIAENGITPIFNKVESYRWNRLS